MSTVSNPQAPAEPLQLLPFDEYKGLDALSIGWQPEVSIGR